jgi:hypothetical protein
MGVRGEPYPMPRVPPVTRAVLLWSAHLPEDPIAVPEVFVDAISLLLCSRVAVGLCGLSVLSC